jgi:hypothetical protein
MILAGTVERGERKIGAAPQTNKRGHCTDAAMWRTAQVLVAVMVASICAHAEAKSDRGENNVLSAQWAPIGG